MKTLFYSLALFAMTAVPQAYAQHHSTDQQDLLKGRQAGALRSSRDIEAGLIPQMKRHGADYIGQEYDSATGRYRYKFMRNGSVIWVDVDGRTGAIVGRAGE